MGKEYSYDIVVESFNLAVNINNTLRPYYSERYYRSNIDQLNRSSSSVSANIAESQNSKTTKEKVRYYRIALKSCRESIHWMNFLEATMPNGKELFKLYIPEMDKIKKILISCINKLNDDD